MVSLPCLCVVWFPVARGFRFRYAGPSVLSGTMRYFVNLLPPHSGDGFGDCCVCFEWVWVVCGFSTRSRPWVPVTRGVGVVPAKGLSWPLVVRLLVRVSPPCVPRPVHAPSCPGWRGACAGVRSSSRPMSVTYWCLVFPVFWVQGSFPCPMLASACSPLGSSLLLPHSGPGAGALVRCAYRTLPYSPSGSLWQVLVFPGHVFRPRFAHCCSVDVVTAGAAAPFSMSSLPRTGNVCYLCFPLSLCSVAVLWVPMAFCLPSSGLPLRCPRMCALPLFSL